MLKGKKTKQDGWGFRFSPHHISMLTSVDKPTLYACPIDVKPYPFLNDAIINIIKMLF